MRNSRLDKDSWLMEVAKITSERSTCSRRAVGCVIVDHHYRIIATGYNGVPSGITHCIESPCTGADLPSGTGLDRCLAIHAEQNALMQCSDTKRIHAIYTTTFPCMHCLKMILNTSVKVLYYKEAYAGIGEGLSLLTDMGIFAYKVQR